MNEEKIQSEKKSDADTVKKTASKAVVTDTKVETVVTSKKKRGKRRVAKGQARIKSTYNNTIVTITDLNGAVLGWSSAGLLGFKGAKKSTPYAATQVVADVVEKIQKHGVQELQVFVKGVGSSRDAAIRGLAAQGLTISLIKDTTPVAHNGCRHRKPRRV